MVMMMSIDDVADGWRIQGDERALNAARIIRTEACINQHRVLRRTNHTDRWTQALVRIEWQQPDMLSELH